jgi:hypothetical protein
MKIKMKTTIFFKYCKNYLKKGKYRKALKTLKNQMYKLPFLALRNPSPCITTFQGAQPFHLPFSSSKITHTHKMRKRKFHNLKCRMTKPKKVSPKPISHKCLILCYNLSLYLNPLHKHSISGKLFAHYLIIKY